MLQILYVSGASGEVSNDDLEDILATSRRNNPSLGVTGMLLWGDGVFIQVLEGETRTVHGLAARIRNDPRHRNFMVLFEQTTDQRVFANWSMGYKQLDPGKQADRQLFAISRDALEARISGHDNGLFLETVLAFGRDLLSKAA